MDHSPSDQDDRLRVDPESVAKADLPKLLTSILLQLDQHRREINELRRLVIPIEKE